MTVLFLAAMRKVFCTFKMMDAFFSGQRTTCTFSHTMHTEYLVLGSELNTTVERFEISGNKKVKFLPRLIGEKFPNLKEFRLDRCGLTVVRKYYFKGMRSVRFMNLHDNEINIIEPESFNDLVSVGWLYLPENKIETLDENLFVAMVKLEWLNLDKNKIKFLSSATFRIPGGILKMVMMTENDCINQFYGSTFWNQMERDIIANCTR